LLWLQPGLELLIEADALGSATFALSVIGSRQVEVEFQSAR